MKKLVIFIAIICLLIGVWFVYSEIFSSQAQYSEAVTFTIDEGESVKQISQKLEQQHIIRNAGLFNFYARWKGIDRQIHHGEFTVTKPITIARVVQALLTPGGSEQTITILPGWDLRDIAEYLQKEGIIKNENELYDIAGIPAVNYKTFNSIKEFPHLDIQSKLLADKPSFISYEGFLAPDTYRIFKNSTATDIVKKLIFERNSQFTDKMYEDVKKSDRTLFEVITMASIVEREVRGKEDKSIVADIFWRRYDMNWALQADSTVHYAVGKKGNVFTTKEDRDSMSEWNTYRWPGLPLGPISNPSLESIIATIYPTKNNNWYFLTATDGSVKYGKTLEEHNQNVFRYLR